MKNSDLDKSLSNDQRFNTVLKFPPFLKMQTVEIDFVLRSIKIINASHKN